MQLLLIEDNPDHADILMECIQKAFKGNANITWYTEFFPALELLNNPIRDQRPDICFCDLQLPDSSIQETISELNSLDTSVPIIILTSLHDEDKAKELIKGGAQDYISKDDLNASQLYKTCTYAIERQRQTVLLEEKNRDQAAFCYSLSHDFKGPIRRIGNSIQFLREDLSKRIELTNQELEYFTSIEKNASVINKLIEDLYQYLNLDIQRENFADLSLDEVVQEAKDLINSDKNQSDISISPLPNINGNRAQLVILFKNLLENSLKYCEGNPIIHIRNEVSTDDRFAVISVRDNGIGMEANKISRIFNPFERLHSNELEAGSGLGLSIVKRIVDNHHGVVHVDSAPRSGTTFTLTFPYFL